MANWEVSSGRMEAPGVDSPTEAMQVLGHQLPPAATVVRGRTQHTVSVSLRCLYVTSYLYRYIP